MTGAQSGGGPRRTRGPAAGRAAAAGRLRRGGGGGEGVDGSFCHVAVNGCIGGGCQCAHHGQPAPLLPPSGSPAGLALRRLCGLGTLRPASPPVGSGWRAPIHLQSLSNVTACQFPPQTVPSCDHITPHMLHAPPDLRSSARTARQPLHRPPIHFLLRQTARWRTPAGARRGGRLRGPSGRTASNCRIPQPVALMPPPLPLTPRERHARRQPWTSDARDGGAASGVCQRLIGKGAKNTVAQQLPFPSRAPLVKLWHAR